MNAPATTGLVYATGDPVLSVFVDGAPVSANRMYRSGRGKVYLTPDAREWEVGVEGAVKTEVVFDGLKPTTWSRPLSVCLTFTLARSGDVDNYVKATLDGLKHGLAVDDRHFGMVEARLNEQPEYRHRYPDGKRVRATGCLIEVWPASAPEPEPQAEDDSSLVPVDRARAIPMPGGRIAIVLPPMVEQEVYPLSRIVSLAEARDLLTDLQRIPALGRTTGAA